MATEKLIKLVDLKNIDESAFTRRCVSCLILTRDNKILLQQRGTDWQTFPGCLAAFGGTIDSNETPIQALVRELHEELGAKVNVDEIVSLGAATEGVTHYKELNYLYFWHDKDGTITGCYEGEARYYDDVKAPLSHPKIMDDVQWLLRECRQRKLIKR